MKLNIPESTRKRIAAEMMSSPEGYDRNDWDGLKYATKIAAMGERLADAKRDSQGRLDLSAEVWNEVIERLSCDSDELAAQSEAIRNA